MKSLTTKLLVLYLTVFIFSAAVFTCLSYYVGRRAILEEYQIRGAEHSREIALMIHPYFPEKNVEGITSILQTFGEAEDVVSVLTYDAEGEFWIESSSVEVADDEIPLENRQSRWHRHYTMKNGRFVTEFGQAVYTKNTAVIGGQAGETPIGWVRILFDFSPVHSRLQSLLIKTMALLGMVILSGGFVFRFFLKRSLRNIAPLVRATQQVAGGNLAVTVPRFGEDELGQLAESFNIMTARVREAHEGLEKRVAERTSELERTQDTLRQSQKMEAVGRLAGGIAHDFNNLLGIITGYCELSLPGLKDGDPLQDNLREIQGAGERAATLTHQLLAFSRRQVLEIKVLNLNDVLGRMDRMLRRLIGEDISLVTFLDPGLGQAKADPGQMEQVVLNLALNARDAMPQGGKLILETKNVELDQEYVRQHPEVQPGPYVMMAVSDTGTGMDAKTKEHIFEPFFTTKEKGKGTGLGLSTVYGIVKQSGGHLSVYSEPGHGTSVKVYLSRVEEKAELLALPELPTTATKGSETVLVVEDEERLRRLVSQILQGKGYSILEASSGEEALRMSGSHEGPIALLLTDVIMPGLSGRETAEKLSSKRPGIRILYMSGYTDNVIAHHGVLEKGTHFLQKPFAPEALARKVREVLGTR